MRKMVKKNIAAETPAGCLWTSLRFHSYTGYQTPGLEESLSVSVPDPRGELHAVNNAVLDAMQKCSNSIFLV